MTIFAAIRGFTYLARDAYSAAAGLLCGPGLPGYDDADLLAEHEAAEEFSEPVSPFGPFAAPGPDGVVCADGCDAWSISSNCKQHAGAWEPQDDCGLGAEREPWGLEDKPNATEPWCDCPLGVKYPNHVCVPFSAIWEPPLTADELVAVRQLIEERFPPHAPVASASPPTPADATGLTLANDPQSVHQRHMRRLLGEDQGRP
jgi:hypothetical protein